MRLHLSICVCLCLSIHLRLSICCLRLSICLRLSVYLYASVYRIYLRLSATASVSIWPGLSLCRSVYLSIGRSGITRYVCLWPVCLWPVCVRVCDYTARTLPFCAASYFLGAAPSKSPVKQHSDTNHSANVGQAVCGYLSIVCGYLSIVCRGLTSSVPLRPLTRAVTRGSDHKS